MRVLQLIDSLRPGGAEKMAVNIANALVDKIDRSFLCCTRLEGSLLQHINSEVTYFFLDKNNRFDYKALRTLKRIIEDNNINIVHAHGTSFFFPALIKFSSKKFNLIWHIHNGGIKNSPFRDQIVIRFFSSKFSGIIAVNSDLKEWAKDNLLCKQVIQCKNFISESRHDEKTVFHFKGEENSFKIICLANIRPEKGHIYLLEALEKLKVDIPYSLHLIGAIPENFQTTLFYKKYQNSPVKDKIYLYGSQENIAEILNGGDLGVLASDFEGLPMALLEYGFAGLPVVVTDVGFCKEIVGNNGILIPSKSSKALTKALHCYIKNPQKRKIDAAKLKHSIKDNFSEHTIVPSILAFYKQFV